MQKGPYYKEQRLFCSDCLTLMKYSGGWNNVHTSSSNLQNKPDGLFLGDNQNKKAAALSI